MIFLTRKVEIVLLVTMIVILGLSMVQMTPAQEERRGPKIDKLRMKVIKSPDAQLIGMVNREVDILEGLIRTGDIEELDSRGFTITSALGFHMGHIAFNLRPDQSYRRPEITFWPLADVNFRHALFHLYNQKEIVPAIYKYIVEEVRSLVPPAQAEWTNPSVPTHPYNPGDPFATTVYNPETGENHDACSILRYGGYSFVDADGGGTVTPDDYWKDPYGTPMPDLRMFTPTYEVAPTSAEHGARFIEGVATIGLAGTPENGDKGLIHEPAEFWPYLIKVFKDADFDLYMVFWGLGRFPDHLYDMLHSSQISGPPPVGVAPWLYNAPAVNSSEYIDPLVETIKFSLNHTKKLEDCFKVQELLYDPSDPNPDTPENEADKYAMSYMQLYSRTYWNAFQPGMRGIVNSPGYGSDNSWTYLNMYWEPGHPNERIEDGKSTIIYCLGEEPERLNILYASTVYAITIMAPTLDGLLEVDPYRHRDLPWMLESWDPATDIEGPLNFTTPNTGMVVTNGMVVTYYLRSGLIWQDGQAYTAEDAKFNWEFLRDNEIPRFLSTWKYITDVEVVDPLTVKVYSNVTSQFLPLDFAGVAALLPPQVWADWDGLDLDIILGRDPSKEEYSGGGEITLPTNLFGTGPFIFDSYDETGMVAELHQNPNYFKTTAEIEELKKYLFWETGDIDAYNEPQEDPGWVFSMDKARLGKSYALSPGDAEYDPYADIAVRPGEPGPIVDLWDRAIVNVHINELRTIPWEGP